MFQATFVITIPFKIAQAPAKKEAEEEEKPNNIEGVKLLLVEDNELNAEIAEVLLVDAGHGWPYRHQNHPCHEQGGRKDNPHHCHDCQCLLGRCETLSGCRNERPSCQACPNRRLN